MAIFTATEIEQNWLYAPVMEQINELHDEMGAPAAPNSGPTTGGSLDPAYTADSIGDWDGHEDEVAEWANERREEVFNALNMGSFPYYYQSETWTEFANQAYQLVCEFEAHHAFTRLCDEWDNHQ